MSQDNQTTQAQKDKTKAYQVYPVNLTIEYSERLSRVTTLFRWILAIPIYFLLESFLFHIDFSRVFNHLGHKAKHHAAQAAHHIQTVQHQVGAHAGQHGHHIFSHQLPEGIFLTAGYLVLPVFLMILFRKKYPLFVFNFNVSLLALFQRLYAYMLFLIDEYPNTDEQGKVHLSIEYPEPGQLNRFLPFIKMLLIFPHIICLIILVPLMILAALISWIVVIFTGKYPQAFFKFIVGVMQWIVRVLAYAFLLMTDKYPPFSLK